MQNLQKWITEHNWTWYLLANLFFKPASTNMTYFSFYALFTRLFQTVISVCLLGNLNFHFMSQVNQTYGKEKKIKSKPKL